MPVVRERLNYCWAAAAFASANGFYYYLHTCCSRGIVLNKNSNFHTCISRCCRVRAPRRRRPRRACRRSLGYGIGCRISWQSGKTDVATSVCLAQHTHTDTEQTQPQHTLVSHTLSLSAGLSLSLLRAQWFVLRSVCFSRFESWSWMRQRRCWLFLALWLFGVCPAALGKHVCWPKWFAKLV